MIVDFAIIATKAFLVLFMVLNLAGVLGWIERIPFSETKGYVQRVIENSVVYDAMNPASRQQSLHVSRYLGRNRPA